MADLLVSMGLYPSPAGPLPYGERAEQMMTTWREHMGEHPDDGSGDFEDFWEMAARLDAVISQGNGQVWLELPKRDVATEVHDGALMPLDMLHDEVAESKMLHYGPLGVFSPLWRIIDSRADRYLNSRVFGDFAGRLTYSCGFRCEGTEISDVMAQMARDGHSEVIIKAAQAKHGLWRVPVSTDVAESERNMLAVLDWAPINKEGDDGAFSVQQIIEMSYEYRVFIVNGVPVTGAGCVEEHTPLDAVEGQPFSTLVRKRRPVGLMESDYDEEELRAEPTEPDPIENRPDVIEQFVQFATLVAAAAVRSDEMPDSYVLDVAMSSGSPVVVEMNGLTNSGLYASDPRRVVAAMVQGR